MGSRIIHMCIAKKILSTGIKLDERRFVVGNLAPDADNGNKADSHFVLANQDEKLGRYIDFEAFLVKYKNKLEDSFYIGYLCHLIMDELWYGNVYNPAVAGANCSEIEMLKLYYDDLRTLNSKLIDQYSLKYNIGYFDDYDLDEINKFKLMDILSESEKDFNSPLEIANRKLMLIAENHVLRHIENSTNVFFNRLTSFGVKFNVNGVVE